MSAPHINDNVDDSLACIDSQDESFVLPIRQYLEAHGCVVTTGKSSGKIPLYHIAAGDEDFVKRIFSSEKNSGTRRLALVFYGVEESPRNFFHAVDAKIIFLPPRELGAREVETIFAFFFTGDQPVLNLMPPGSEKPVKKNSHKEDDIRKQDEDRIKKTMQEIFQEKEKIPYEKKLILGNEKKKHISWTRLIFFVFFVSMLPVVWYALSVVGGVGGLALAGKFLLVGNILRAKQSEKISGYWVNQGKAMVRIISTPVSFVGGQSMIHEQERLWGILDDLQKGVDGGVTAIENGRTTMQKLLANDPTKKEGDLAKGIDDMRNSLFLVQTHLGLAQGELKEFMTKRSFPFLKKINSSLTKVRSETEIMGNLLSLYQKISGFSQKKTYLLLFQNSMELRPTGGFIGSIGIATFADGKLSDLQIQDVYAVDGQLKGHVDPPEPIANLLSQEHWYLRDSNWDPDFSASGSRAAWFYEKETGAKVDGVIGISVPLLQQLLLATGPISLPDYNDRITAENFFGKSLYYTQKNFFPGSTQKKDFLGTLTSAIIGTLTMQKNIDSFSVFRAFTKSLINHDVLFSFSDPQIEALAVSLGWGGAVPPKNACDDPRSSCFLDYAYLVDANLSVNKVNYFVKRTMVRKIAITESGSIKETVTVSYQNTSVGDAGGGGNYRNFARFYAPADSSFTTITVDGRVVHTKQEQKITPAQPPYSETEPAIGNLSGVGVAFDIPASSERRLVISYERKKPLLFVGGKSSLTVYTQRQPGNINTSLETLISYPIFWTASAEPEKTGEVVAKQVFLAKDAQFEYNTDLSEDRELKLTFFK